LRIAAAVLLLALPATAQAPGWEARAAEWSPAFRACLDGRAGGMVVEAWEAEGGIASRLLLPGGGARGLRGEPRRTGGVPRACGRATPG
jgi:hypothetical protein